MTVKTIVLRGIATIVAVVVVVFLLTVESYTLVAEGPVLVRQSPTLPFDSANILVILGVGEKAEVAECVDYKSDIAMKVVVPGQDGVGYVSEGLFRLEREANPLQYLLSDTRRLVWSCRDFFPTRKRKERS
jgi:hypothetical protein